MRTVGNGEASPAAKSDVEASAAVHGEGVEGPSGLPLAVGPEGVAATLAETMRSPWRTPPAVIVDLEPLRSLRKLMIQASYKQTIFFVGVLLCCTRFCSHFGFGFV